MLLLAILVVIVFNILAIVTNIKGSIVVKLGSKKPARKKDLEKLETYVNTLIEKGNLKVDGDKVVLVAVKSDIKKVDKK
jgi:hypothetical protein